jgi:hypothetical protein
MASTQVPPFAQGLEAHSSTSVSQLGPVYLLEDNSACAMYVHCTTRVGIY